MSCRARQSAGSHRRPGAPSAVHDRLRAQVIQDAPIEEWPRCNALLVWHSSGFPLAKAQLYVALTRPFLINDVFKQDLLRDRRAVYSELAKAGVPTPRHIVVTRTTEEAAAAADPAGFVETHNYVEMARARLLRPRPPPALELPRARTALRMPPFVPASLGRPAVSVTELHALCTRRCASMLLDGLQSGSQWRSVLLTLSHAACVMTRQAAASTESLRGPRMRVATACVCGASTSRRSRVFSAAAVCALRLKLLSVNSTLLSTNRVSWIRRGATCGCTIAPSGVASPGVCVLRGAAPSTWKATCHKRAERRADREAVRREAERRR